MYEIAILQWFMFYLILFFCWKGVRSPEQEAWNAVFVVQAWTPLDTLDWCRSNDEFLYFFYLAAQSESVSPISPSVRHFLSKSSPKLMNFTYPPSDYVLWTWWFYVNLLCILFLILVTDTLRQRKRIRGWKTQQERIFKEERKHWPVKTSLAMSTCCTVGFICWSNKLKKRISKERYEKIKHKD